MSNSVTWPHGGAPADLAALRSAGPLTHCLTNVVAAPLSANVLLALGAALPPAEGQLRQLRLQLELLEQPRLAHARRRAFRTDRGTLDQPS